LALTTTEFLFTVGLRKRGNPIFQELGANDAIRISSVSLIDTEAKRINPSASIIEQTNKFYSGEATPLLTDEERRYLGDHYNRFMHRTRTMGNPYVLGRHQFKYPAIDKPLYIMKLLYSPYPEFYARKLQIRGKMAKSNVEQGWGFQHMMEFKDMQTKYERLKQAPMKEVSDMSSGELYNIYRNLYK